MNCSSLCSPPWIIKLALTSFSAGLIPTKWRRGIWSRIMARWPASGFLSEITIDNCRFCVPVVPGTNDVFVLEGLDDYEDEVFIALRRALRDSRPVILDVGGNLVSICCV